MKILLINNHSLLNAGDYAILAETVRMLEARFPAAQITLVFNDTESARAALPNYVIVAAPLSWAAPLDAHGQYQFAPHWLRLLYIGLLLLAALCYRAIGWLPPLFLDRSKRELLHAFAQADLVLACGGGYIYAPGTGEGWSGWFAFMLSGCVLALLMRKPLALLPQSIGPLHDDFQRRAVRWVVRRAQLTCVRERRSLELLEQLGCADRALRLPDLAFGSLGGGSLGGGRWEVGGGEIRRPQTPDQQTSGLEDWEIAAMRQSSVVGRLQAIPHPPSPIPHPPASFRVGITALNWSGQSFTFSKQAEYENALLGCIDSITSQDGDVVLFAQCCGPSAAEDDRHVSARLRARAAIPARVTLIDQPWPPDVLQAAYGQMDYFIGTRMHSVILALNAGVPALAIGYLHKTSGVLHELGMHARCYDIETLTADELIAGLAQLRADGAPAEAAPYLVWARRSKHALAELLGMLVERV